MWNTQFVDSVEFHSIKQSQKGFPHGAVSTFVKIARFDNQRKKIHHDPNTVRAVLVTCTPFSSGNNLETSLLFVLRDQPPV